MNPPCPGTAQRLRSAYRSRTYRGQPFLRVPPPPQRFVRSQLYTAPAACSRQTILISHLKFPEVATGAGRRIFGCGCSTCGWSLPLPLPSLQLPKKPARNFPVRLHPLAPPRRALGAARLQALRSLPGVRHPRPATRMSPSKTRAAKAAWRGRSLMHSLNLFPRKASMRETGTAPGNPKVGRTGTSPVPEGALPVSAVPPEPGKHSPRNPQARRNVSILRNKL